MGARETEEHVSKLSKQNFDLKLEVFHRREKAEELERKVAQLEEMLETRTSLEEENKMLRADNEELMDVNEELLGELELRDTALDEAVGLICDLEQRLEVLRSGRHPVSGNEQHDMTALVPNLGSDAPGVIRMQDGQLPDGVAPTRSSSADPRTPANRPKHKPSFLFNQQSNVGALKSLYLEKVHGPRKHKSYASSLPKPANDDDDASLAPRSLSGSSDTEADSTMHADHSSAMRTLSARPSSSNQIHSARVRRARTNLWVVDRALSPSGRTSLPQGSSPPEVEFASLDSVLQGVPLRSSSLSPSKQMDGPVLGAYSNDRPIRPSKVSHDSNVFPPTPDTMSIRPLRHASPSIGRGQRASSRSPLSHKQLKMPAASLDVSPVTGGGHITTLNSILPYDVAFYYDGPSFDAQPTDEDVDDLVVPNTKLVLDEFYTPSKRRRAEEARSSQAVDRLFGMETIRRTPLVKSSPNVRNLFNDHQEPGPVYVVQRESRPTHQLVSPRSEPITTTLARQFKDPSTELNPARQHSSMETANEALNQIPSDVTRHDPPPTTPKASFPIPPRRTSSLRHSATYDRALHSRAPSSSGIPFISLAKHHQAPHASTQTGKSPPLPAAVTTLTITSPVFSAAERAVHSSMSAHSEPSRASTVSGSAASWVKIVESSSENEGVSDGRGSPTVVVTGLLRSEKEGKKASMGSSLVRRFSLRRMDSGKGRDAWV